MPYIASQYVAYPFASFKNSSSALHIRHRTSMPRQCWWGEPHRPYFHWCPDKASRFYASTVLMRHEAIQVPRFPFTALHKRHRTSMPHQR